MTEIEGIRLLTICHQFTYHIKVFSTQTVWVREITKDWEEINDDCKGQEGLHINLIDSPEEISSWEQESVSSTVAELMRMGNQK